MSENLGVHVQLTADEKEFVDAYRAAYRELTAFRDEAERLKAEERALNNDVKTLTSTIHSKEKQLETAKNKLRELTEAGKANNKTTENQRTKIKSLETSIVTLNARLEENKQKLRENADVQANAAARTQKSTIDINNATNAYIRHTQQITDTGKAYDRSAIQAGNMAGQLKSAFLILKGLALGYAGKTLFEALIGGNAEFEQSMTSFDVLLGSAEEAQKKMDELEQFAAVTSLAMDDVTKATNLLLGYGVAADDVVDTMSRLGDLSQGNAEKFGRVTLAYGQMLAKGKVTGEEMRQMVEAQVPLLQGLADYLQVSTAELQDMVSDGAVGIDDLNGAIRAMTSEGGKFFGMMEKQSQTMSGMWSTLLDNISILSREVGEGAFEGLKEQLSGLVESLDSNEKQFSQTAQSIGGSVAIVTNSIVGLIQILWSMRGALGTAGAAWAAYRISMTVTDILSAVKTGHEAFTAAMQISNAATKSGTVIETAYNLITGKTVLLKNTETGAIGAVTAAKAEEVLATKSATVAQIELNTAMLASPWFWVIAAIGTTITVVSALTTSYDEQLQKLEEVKSAYEDISSELDSAKKELDTTGKRIDELNAKGTLTLTEDDELTKLQQTNSELEKRIRWLEKEKEIKESQASDETVETIEKRFNSLGRNFSDFATAFFRTPTQEGRDDIVLSHTGMQDYELYAQKIIELRQKINEESDPKKLEVYNKSLTDYLVKIADARNELDGLAKSVTGTGKAAQDAKNKAENAVAFMDSVIYSAEELRKMKFDEIFDADSFKESKEQLLELAKAGELTPETIESYQEFKEMMAETGVTAQQLADEITASAQNTQSSGADVQAVMNESLELLGKYQEKVDLLNEAQENYNDTGHLSAEMLKKLTENDLLQYLELSENGLRINKQALVEEGEAAKEAALQNLQEAAAEDIRNLALGETEKLSDTAKNAIQKMGDAAETAGNKARNSAGGLMSFAAGLHAIANAQRGNLFGTDPLEYTQKTDAIIKEYERYASALSNINISSGGGKSSGTKGSGSNGSKKGKNTAAKDYESRVTELMNDEKREAERLLAYGKITEQEYAALLQKQSAQYAAYADDVLKQTNLTEAEKLEIRKKFIEKAEDLDLDYFKKLKGFAKAELDAMNTAHKDRMSESEAYLSDRAFYDDWDKLEDSELAAIGRMQTHIGEDYEARQKQLDYYFEQQLLTQKEYQEQSEKLYLEFSDEVSDISRKTFSAAQKAMDKFLDDTSGVIEDYYKAERALAASAAHEGAAAEIARAEEQVRAVNRAFEASRRYINGELDKLDAEIEAHKRQSEDEDDETRRKRLAYLLEYEHDDDNIRALEKQLDALDDEINEKIYNREAEDKRAALQAQLDEIDERYDREYEAASELVDRRREKEEKAIDAIYAKYEKLMSMESITGEMYNFLNQNGDICESIGDLMGSQMVEGLQKQMDGFLASVNQRMQNAGLLPSSGGRGFGDRIISQNNSRSINQSIKVYGATPASGIALAGRKILDELTLRSEL